MSDRNSVRYTYLGDDNGDNINGDGDGDGNADGGGSVYNVEDFDNGASSQSLPWPGSP